MAGLGALFSSLQYLLRQWHPTRRSIEPKHKSNEYLALAWCEFLHRLLILQILLLYSDKLDCCKRARSISGMKASPVHEEIHPYTSFEAPIMVATKVNVRIGSWQKEESHSIVLCSVVHLLCSVVRESRAASQARNGLASRSHSILIAPEHLLCPSFGEHHFSEYLLRFSMSSAWKLHSLLRCTKISLYPLWTTLRDIRNLSFVVRNALFWEACWSCMVSSSSRAEIDVRDLPRLLCLGCCYQL